MGIVFITKRKPRELQTLNDKLNEAKHYALVKHDAHDHDHNSNFFKAAKDVRRQFQWVPLDRLAKIFRTNRDALNSNGVS